MNCTDNFFTAKFIKRFVSAIHRFLELGGLFPNFGVGFGIPFVRAFTKGGPGQVAQRLHQRGIVCGGLRREAEGLARALSA